MKIMVSEVVYYVVIHKPNRELVLVP